MREAPGKATLGELKNNKNLLSSIVNTHKSRENSMKNPSVLIMEFSNYQNKVNNVVSMHQALNNYYNEDPGHPVSASVSSSVFISRR